jgi:hypothetical protein
VLDGDDGFAGKFDVAVLVPGCQRKLRAALAIVFDELGDMALAGQARTELGLATKRVAKVRSRGRTAGQCLAGQAITNMPCAKTSGYPAALAKSRSTWIGL